MTQNPNPTRPQPIQQCIKCHARVAGTAGSQNASACPACGSYLMPVNHQNLDPPDAPYQQADHRGILLPRRHAVGGVITPR